VINVAKLVKMRSDESLRSAVLSTDLVLADGMGIVWASRIVGDSLPERVAGIDLFQDLLSLADTHRLTVYFLGAQEDVLADMMRHVRDCYPNVTICGSRDGYFSEEEAEGAARDVARSRPDILFIGISSPKKELFLARWGDTLGALVSHGVGGSFDVLAGRVGRAPMFLQRIGLEWLYRLLQEPRRLLRRYLVTNSVFCALVLRELFTRRRRDRRSLGSFS